ncbi:MAG TPA: hypothetical protein VJ946_10835 [Bacteroidales bacterium]|nr:hypothetical protein [Bacteroidales bacterium]
MKTLPLIILITLAVMGCQPSDRKNISEEPIVNEASFIWKGDSLGNFYHSHSKILLPVAFDQTCTREAYFTLHHGIKTQNIYTDFADSVGTLSANKDSSTAEDISGKLGTICFGPKRFNVIPRDNNTPDSIAGEISLDFFSGKEIMINFRERKIKTCTDFRCVDSCKFDKYSIYMDSKMLIPVKINNQEYTFLLNPESALYVIFNPIDEPSEIAFCGKSWNVPDSRTVSDANPAFHGILGLAFLKDKIMIIRPEEKEFCVLNELPE